MIGPRIENLGLGAKDREPRIEKHRYRVYYQGPPPWAVEDLMPGSIMSCEPVPWIIWPGVHEFAAAATSACLLLFPPSIHLPVCLPLPIPSRLLTPVGPPLPPHCRLRTPSHLLWALPSRPTGHLLPVRPQPHLTGIHTDSCGLRFGLVVDSGARILICLW